MKLVCYACAALVEEMQPFRCARRGPGVCGDMSPRLACSVRSSVFVDDRTRLSLEILVTQSISTYLPRARNPISHGGICQDKQCDVLPNTRFFASRNRCLVQLPSPFSADLKTEYPQRSLGTCTIVAEG